VFTFLAAFLFVQTAWAEDGNIDSLKKEIQELKVRLQQVEKESQENDLASRVDQYINYNALGEGEDAECGFFSGKGLQVDFGGFIKVDSSYDTHRTNNGNFAWWVNGPNAFGDSRDDEFNMTARQSRFWFKFDGPENGDIKTSGKLEWDFYGTGFAENKNALLLRHAFLKAVFSDGWELLAGQTSDIMSPLVPRTVNYTVQWQQGNPGYRRPQVRVTKKCKLGEGTLSATLGATRTIGGNLGGTGDDGADAGFPTGAVAFGYTAPCPFFGGRKASLIFSGHYGEEEIDTAMGKVDANTWSVNISGALPICEFVTVKGEWFTGDNLGSYLAGIGQKIDPATNKEISSKGGWINFLITPPSLKGWTFTVGWGLDKPHGSCASYSKLRNAVYFANFFYNVTSALKVGFEISHLATTYASSAGQMKDTRAQWSFIYYL